jgi:MFS family permease
MTAPVGIPNRKVNISLLLAVVFISAFIDGLDGSIVNIALPDIATDMSADTTMVSWVSITYMLVLASTLVPFAKMASTVSVRRIMTIGLTIQHHSPSYKVQPLFACRRPTSDPASSRALLHLRYAVSLILKI